LRNPRGSEAHDSSDLPASHASGIRSEDQLIALAPDYAHRDIGCRCSVIQAQAGGVH